MIMILFAMMMMMMMMMMMIGARIGMIDVQHMQCMHESSEAVRVTFRLHSTCV